MKKVKFLKPIIFLAIAAGFGAIVMLLWNWLMTTIFGLGTVNFWQALGILVLCRILFGKFGGARHIMHGVYGRNRLREKWMKMTPEQRKELIQKRREYFGFPQTGL